MNNPNSKFESTLATKLQFPDSPIGLRSSVESAVVAKLKRQTFFDDMKWLALTFGLLFGVVVLQFSLFSSTTKKLEALTSSTLTSVEQGGRFKPTKLRHIPALLIEEHSLLNPTTDPKPNQGEN